MTKDEALKLALEALKQIDEAMPFPVAKLAQAVIKEALAQPEQKTKMVGRITDNIKDMVLRQEVMLYTDKYLPIGTPVYTTPPQRKPLTDEEVNKLVDDEDWYNDPHGFVRAIEAAHNIKDET
jgi:hypothetical protein